MKETGEQIDRVQFLGHILNTGIPKLSRCSCSFVFFKLEISKKRKNLLSKNCLYYTWKIYP